MGVNLCGRYVAVAEHCLYASQVCTVHKQICSKRVPEGVRANMLSNASGQGVVGD